MLLQWSHNLSKNYSEKFLTKISGDSKSLQSVLTCCYDDMNYFLTWTTASKNSRKKIWRKSFLDWKSSKFWLRGNSPSVLRGIIHGAELRSGAFKSDPQDLFSLSRPLDPLEIFHCRHLWHSDYELSNDRLFSACCELQLILVRWTVVQERFIEWSPGEISYF